MDAKALRGVAPYGNAATSKKSVRILKMVAALLFQIKEKLIYSKAVKQSVSPSAFEIFLAAAS